MPTHHRLYPNHTQHYRNLFQINYYTGHPAAHLPKGLSGFIKLQHKNVKCYLKCLRCFKRCLASIWSSWAGLYHFIQCLLYLRFIIVSLRMTPCLVWAVSKIALSAVPFSFTCLATLWCFSRTREPSSLVVRVHVLNL